MRVEKTIERVIDMKNSQAYVKYTDGASGFILTQWVPEALLVSYNQEKANVSTNNRTR